MSTTPSALTADSILNVRGATSRLLPVSLQFPGVFLFPSAAPPSQTFQNTALPLLCVIITRALVPTPGRVTALLSGCLSCLWPAQHPPGQGWVESLLHSPLSFVPCSSHRGSFLVLLLRECFRDLGWLATVHNISGEVGLLVTSIVPQTPFFWAMVVTETLLQNMQALFSALAEAEEQQPYLHDSAVRRGTRCLAEYHLGDYGRAWNRCWVLDRVDSWAVVMFIDFGRLATIPVQSLRSLDSDSFWTIPPLTQPFMLEKNVLSSYKVIHRILKGKITGALNLESHILKFEEFK
nr:tudor domain-containing protein 10 isoform X2 [Vicugna pacos]